MPQLFKEHSGKDRQVDQIVRVPLLLRALVDLHLLDDQQIPLLCLGPQGRRPCGHKVGDLLAALNQILAFDSDTAGAVSTVNVPGDTATGEPGIYG